MSALPSSKVLVAPSTNVFFVVVLAVITAIMLAVHWTILQALIQILPALRPITLTLLKAAFGILAVSFIATSIVTSVRYTRIGESLYRASSVWLGTAYWLFFASALLFAVIWIGRLAGSALPVAWIGLGLFAAAIALSTYGLVHAHDTRVTRYDVALPDLPANWEGKTIALVADVHLGNIRRQSFSKKTADLIAAQNAELVLIAGDFYDGPPVPFAEITEPFRNLNAAKGTYFANGNHEEYRENSQYIDALKNVGVRVLKDEFVSVDGLQIIGVNYSTTKSDAAATEVLRAIPFDANQPTILIKHIPNGVPAVEAAGIHLQVSGHTHGGQVWPGRWLTNRVYKGFAYGHRFHNGLQVITTSGAGTWGPPQRVGTDGEIVIMTLHKKNC